MNLNSTVNNLEKIATFRFFFLYTSFIMIFEIVMIFFTQNNITNINFQFIKNETGYILVSIAIFSLIANIIPAMLSYIIGLFCKNREIIQFEKDNYIDKDKLLIRALKKQSSVDYQYLHKHKEEKKYLEDLKNNALLFSFAIVSSSFFAHSIMSNIEIYLDTNFFLTILFGLLGLSLFLFIQMVLCSFTDRVYYPKEITEEVQQDLGEK